MKMRKILAWLLIISMAFSALIMTSCNDDDDDKEKNEVPIEDLSPAFDDEVEDFKGGSFSVLTVGNGTPTESFNCIGLVADDNLGDENIVKAVRDRNQRIEKNFNVKIKRVVGAPKSDKDDVLYKEAVSAADAASRTYDAFMLPLTKQINLACQGNLLELNNAVYIDTAQDWWEQGVKEGLLLANGEYYAMGDHQTIDKDATYCTLFNTGLLDQYNKVDSNTLYSLVKEGINNVGGFTMEILNQYARTHATADTNGKNMWEPSYDGIGNYGLYTQTEMTQTILLAAGYSAVKETTSGDYGIKGNVTAEFADAVLKVQGVFGAYANDNWFCNLDKHQNASPTFWDTHARGSFKQNRATFFMCHVGTINNLRDMEHTYGVLPIGKLDSNQKEYGNTVQYYNCQAYSIPNRTTALNEKACYVLEAMAYYSSREYADRESLNYTYYDKVVLAKGLRDDASWEMLDLVFDNRKFDLALAANIGSISDGIKSAASSANGTFLITRYSNLDAQIENMLKTLVKGSAE